MAWLTEKLLGVIDGDNRSFTLTNTPVKESMILYAPGRAFEQVGTQPDTMQYAYSVADNSIELSEAPTSEAERPSCRYWWDDS